MHACAQRLPASPTGSRTLLESYEKVTTAEQIQRRPLNHNTVDLRDYTRTAHSELEILFPVLPNPDIVLYIFPHIKGEVPIPGYTTTFKLYPQNHYALPGEIW